MTSPTQAEPEALKCPQCGANLPPTLEGFIVCQYCGSSLVMNRREGQSGGTEDVFVRGMRLKWFTYTDSEGTGLELFRTLLPVGWQFRGGCRWLLDNPGMPATVAFQLYSPQGAEMFEVLPNMNFTWNSNPMTRMLAPVGSRYFGAEVRQPMQVQQALRTLVLPRYRSGVENLQILIEELQPDLPAAGQVGSTHHWWFSGGRQGSDQLFH